MPAAHAAVCFLFTDIEGSTRLWEQHTERMRAALACHDEIARRAVRAHRGRLVKTTGDGIHAVFDDALDALAATLQMLHTLADPQATAGLALALRCGLHTAAEEARDHDFYGPEVNRAARIMAAAHGGQMLLSQVVADSLRGRLPPGVALRDLGAVRLRDLALPERVWQVLAPPLRADFPALRLLAATPNNLAQPLNRFINREQVLAELHGLLAQHRLVTLLGTGGIGKSRLSAALGGELMDGFADGVWFVELAPLQDLQQAAERVPQAVASVLGVKEAPGRPMTDALRQFVADRQLLLILDNCEHVLDAAASLAKTLLQAGPGVRLLATSREVLRVAGELAYPVPPLGLPGLTAPADATDRAGRLGPAGHAAPAGPAGPAGPAAQADPAAAGHLLQHAAVRLFADRAASAQPAFRLNADNAAAVVEICRRVEGIPLAIELAAARVRVLPVRAIATQLRASFALLSTRDATVAPRQRTLQLLIDWSHDLLAGPERVLYRRLSVFAGGCTLAAAQAVCGGGGGDVDVDVDGGVNGDVNHAGAAGDALAPVAVIDLLAGLVEKSLVAMVPGSEADDGRYRMLDTVRQHAADKLVAAEGQAPGLRRRHVAWCLDVAEQALPQLAGPAQAGVLAGLDNERENLLAALDWCARDTDPAQARAVAEQGFRLSFALRPYWPNRGLLTLALRISLAVLGHPGAQTRDRLRARGLFNVGQLCCFMGRYRDAQPYLEDSLAMATEIGDTARIAAVLQPLGMAALGLGDRQAARRHSEAAVSIARQIGNPRQVAAAVNALAQLERTEGQLEAAESLYAETVQLARAVGDQEVIAVGLLNLAMVALRRGQHAVVRPLLREVMQIADHNGSKPAALCALDVCACLAALQHDALRAARYFGLAEAQNDHFGLRRDPADATFMAPMLDTVRRELGEPGFLQAETQGRELPFNQGWAEAGQWLHAADDPPEPHRVTRSKRTDPAA